MFSVYKIRVTVKYNAVQSDLGKSLLKKEIHVKLIQMLPKLFSTCIYTCPYKVIIKVFCQLPPILQQVIFFIYKTTYYNTFSTLKVSFSTALLSGERFITQFELKIIQTTKSALLDVDVYKPHVMLKLIKEVMIPFQNLLQWNLSNPTPE